MLAMVYRQHFPAPADTIHENKNQVPGSIKLKQPLADSLSGIDRVIEEAGAMVVGCDRCACSPPEVSISSNLALSDLKPAGSRSDVHVRVDVKASIACW